MQFLGENVRRLCRLCSSRLRVSRKNRTREAERDRVLGTSLWGATSIGGDGEVTARSETIGFKQMRESVEGYIEVEKHEDVCPRASPIIFLPNNTWTSVLQPLVETRETYKTRIGPGRSAFAKELAES